MTGFFRTLFFSTFGLSVFLLVAVSCHAEDEIVYVSDVLVINVKSSIESPFQVVDSVLSDEPLTVLKEEEKYLYVKTADEKTGWIAKQYVKTARPKSLIIRDLEDEINGLNQKITALQNGDPSPFEQENILLKDELKSLTEENSTLTEQLQIAQSAASEAATEEIYRLKETAKVLEEEKKELQKQLASFEQNKKEAIQIVRSDLDETNTSLARLAEENERLKKLQHVYWFLAGAGIFFFGLITGKFSFNNKKKSRYSY